MLQSRSILTDPYCSISARRLALSELPVGMSLKVGSAETKEMALRVAVSRRSRDAKRFSVTRTAEGWNVVRVA